MILVFLVLMNVWNSCHDVSMAFWSGSVVYQASGFPMYKACHMCLAGRCGWAGANRRGISHIAGWRAQGTLHIAGRRVLDRFGPQKWWSGGGNIFFAKVAIAVLVGDVVVCKSMPFSIFHLALAPCP
eukprot:gene7540-biopygen12061